jgi:predicted CopG family antitoxin
MDMTRTTVSVSEETLDELYDFKRRGDSYEDVIQRLIDSQRRLNDE